jgi:hypothetical protein
MAADREAAILAAFEFRQHAGSGFIATIQPVLVGLDPHRLGDVEVSGKLCTIDPTFLPVCMSCASRLLSMKSLVASTMTFSGM